MVIYKCECCNYETKLKSNYERHLKTNKHKKKIYECEEKDPHRPAQNRTEPHRSAQIY